MKSNTKQSPETHMLEAIIGVAMQLHSELDNGFPEVIYQRSLAIAFQNISYKTVRVHAPVVQGKI